MIFNYIMIIHNQDGYWAEFPDLDGCHAQGETIDEIMIDAKGALETHIYGILLDGDALPPATDAKKIPLESGDILALVSADVDINKENKSVKKTLTIPAWLNEKAEAQGTNFSKTLQEALINKLYA